MYSSPQDTADHTEMARKWRAKCIPFSTWLSVQAHVWRVERVRTHYMACGVYCVEACTVGHVA